MKKTLIFFLTNLVSILLCQLNSTQLISQILDEQKIQYEYYYNEFQIIGPLNANISLTIENTTIQDGFKFDRSLSINFEKLILRNVFIDLIQTTSELLDIQLDSFIIYQLQFDNVQTKQRIVSTTFKNTKNVAILSCFIKNSNLNNGFGKFDSQTTLSVNNLMIDIVTINSLNGNFFELTEDVSFIMKNCILGISQKLFENQGQERNSQNQNYTNFIYIYSNDPSRNDQHTCSIEIENIQANFYNSNVRFLFINNKAHNTVIRNSHFSHMKSLDSGGCINNSGYGILELTNIVFDSCQSNMFGGALYTASLNITDEITIQNCKSKIGGGAFLANKEYNTITYDKIKYINNHATISSQQYFICTEQADDRRTINCNLFEIDSIYELNAELINTQYYQKKIEIEISHEDFYVERKNISVYKNLIYIIRLRVEYDCAEKNFKQKCYVREFDENQSIGNLYNLISEDKKQLYVNYDLPNANYPYLLISYPPQFEKLTIELFFFFQAGHSFNSRRIGFKLLLTCEKGMQQIFNLRQKELLCKYCDIGSYNNQPNSNCQICDRQIFDNCYANVSYLKQNIWRPYNSQYNDTYLCQLNQKSCNGHNRSGYGNDLCAEGYIGAQCLTCDINGEFWNGEQYGYQGYFKCVKCGSIKNNSLFIYSSASLSIFLFFFTIISSFRRMRAQIYRKYLSFYMKKIYIGCSFIKQKQASVYLKILLFNFQMYLLTYYFVDFNQYDSSIHSSIYNFLNPLQNSEGVSYDCFLKQYFPTSESLGFIKLLISVISPLILNAFVLLIVTIYSQIRKKTYPFFLVSSFLYSIIFVFQPSITQYSIESMTCIQLSSSDSYLMIDTKINCNDQSWRNLMYAVSIPALLIYVFAIPIILFGYIYYNRKQLEKSKIILAFGFMYDEYKREYFYWQFIKLLLSILLSALVSFGKTHIVMCCLIYSGVLSIYSISIICCKPFQQIFINKVELASIILSILYFLSSICLQLEFNQGNQYDQYQMGKIVSEVFYYLVLVSQFIFYLYITIKIMISVFYISVQKMYKYNFFQSFLIRFRLAKLQIYTKNLENNFLRFRRVVKQAIKLQSLENLNEQSEICLSLYENDIKDK